MKYRCGSCARTFDNTTQLRAHRCEDNPPVAEINVPVAPAPTPEFAWVPSETAVESFSGGGGDCGGAGSSGDVE